jgi:hypothetical protein
MILAIVPIFDENKYIRLPKLNSTPELEVQVEPKLPEEDTIVVDTSYLYTPGSPEIEGLEGPEVVELEGLDSSELEELSNPESEGPEASELRGNSAADSTETQET